MARNKYDKPSLDPDPDLKEKEKAILKLIEQGCSDRAELERKIELVRLVEQRAESVDAIFGISTDRATSLAPRLEANARATERVLKSFQGPNAIRGFGVACKHPDLYEEVKDLPRRLRWFALFLREFRAGVGRLAPDVRLLSAVAEYELVEYVKRQTETGRPYYKELAVLLGCTEDNLKMRCASYKKGRVSALAQAHAANREGGAG